MKSDILAQNIRWLRLSLKMSQSLFAKTIGIKKDDLSNWELGRNKPKLDKLKTIAEYFSLTIDALCSTDLSQSELADTKNEAKEDNVLYGNQQKTIDIPHIEVKETYNEASERIKVLQDYIETLKKQNALLTAIIEGKFNVKV